MLDRRSGLAAPRMNLKAEDLEDCTAEVKLPTRAGGGGGRGSQHMVHRIYQGWAAVG
jgi:hypothetical protein